MILNTGAARSVAGNAISGALAGLVLGGVSAYSRLSRGEINKDSALKSTLKTSLQTGIATGCAIAAANALDDATKTPAQGIFSALGLVAVGIAGAYALEATLSTQNAAQITLKDKNDK